jgi:phytoene desaturase
MSKKKVVIIGAGPGGLTAAMLLSSKGYDVEVFEKQDYLGGRNSSIELGDFTFDMGPTFLMMKDILEEMFELAGRNVYDYLQIKSIDPLYRLVYGDGKVFSPTHDRNSMKEQIAQHFPGDYKGYQKYLDYEAGKYDKLIPCLQVPYNSMADFLKPRFIKALPIIDAHRSLFDHLGRYFQHDDLKLAFTFQAKYLGMSPWKCPATFSIISFIEHTGGIHHPIGGLNKISHAMAKVVDEEGGKIHLGRGVKQVTIRGGRAVGIELDSGEDVPADYVVINADFGYAMSNLIPPGYLKKWTPANLKKKGVSCSGYLLYLGVDKLYDIPHHNVIFSHDYKGNVREIADDLVLSEDPSIYIQNASTTDPTLAPEGQSTIYILVPITNNRSGVDWDAEKARYREKVLDIAESRGGLTDLRKHIVAETMLTPKDFEEKKMVYDGAIFNLAHTIDQMLVWRPHNEFEEIERCYLVGGGTHPGSGLPTIYESARISAGIIMKRDAWYLH